MRGRWIILGIILVLIISLCIPATLADGASPQYELLLSYVPKWGKGNFIAGEVIKNGMWGSVNDLYVKVFLQVDGSDEWWAKPTGDIPYSVVKDGKFGITFNTGGDDIHATRLALMLVRPRDARLLDFELANAAALSLVTIDRKPSGEISVGYSYRAEYVDPQETLYRIGANVGFYTQPGTAPGSPLSENHIEAVLRAAAACTTDVRFYSTTGEIAKAYPIARTLGLRVAATAWLDGGENDQAELDALITLCNRGFASMAVVGNETQYQKRLSEDELLKDIAYVRAGVLDRSIPVTTADTMDAYLNSARLRDACDVLGLNVYPYWSGASAGDDSVERSLTGAVAQLARCADGKQIVVTETGWPTGGSYRAGNEGQMENMEAAKSVLWSSEGEVLRIYWFSLADEPWKDADEPGVGSSWGLLDKDLNIKPIMDELFWYTHGEDDFATELDPESDFAPYPFSYTQPNGYGAV